MPSQLCARPPRTSRWGCSKRTLAEASARSGLPARAQERAAARERWSRSSTGLPCSSSLADRRAIPARTFPMTRSMSPKPSPRHSAPRRSTRSTTDHAAPVGHDRSTRSNASRAAASAVPPEAAVPVPMHPTTGAHAKRRGAVFAALAALPLAAALGWWAQGPGGNASPTAPQIAVLAFHERDRPVDLLSIGAGLAEDVQMELARNQGLNGRRASLELRAQRQRSLDG